MAALSMGTPEDEPVRIREPTHMLRASKISLPRSKPAGQRLEGIHSYHGWERIPPSSNRNVSCNVKEGKMMWKPAYDFLYTWGAHYGDSYRDMLQDLQSALDKMKNPVTKQWRELTGALILVNCMEVLRANAFSRMDEQ
uniref:Uncharacterized protein n=1 Tax=Sphaerodactylus townsendi TaxID=933632 RepID=A0ACB8FVZ9_9SAUR